MSIKTQGQKISVVPILQCQQIIIV